ncbi:SPOR domain-containing protein [Nitrosomonas sp.]|uniref:SPOR domain-containing protein n=1 Tax=Nitrosomonas sp. TaxID=42353 RepID=UPI001DE44E88|nr:SPOR domain-containing protein [Nitrosomonas sp.]MBX3616839.1 SPOR domain-containing protein [Nitrosomonas sp.]
MSRDYKSRKSTRSTPEKGGSAFLGGFVGYALGLASAIGIWVYFNYGPNPFLATEKVPSSAEINQKQATVEVPVTPEKVEKEEPVHLAEEKPKFDFYKILPGIDEPEIDHNYRQTAEPPAVEPRVPVKTPEISNKPAELTPPLTPRPAPVITPPEPSPQVAAIQPRSYPAEPAPPPTAPPAPPVTTPPPVKERLFLQAGSFRKSDEAENLKARLALLGLFATIQPIDLAERGIWYRVRVGPFNNRTDIDQASASLKENGINAQFVRIQ